jgi:molybdate transport system ATP-binding protein
VIEIDLQLPLAPFTLAIRTSLSARVTAVVGPSGSGKTSLVESIAGLRRAEGRIVIDGDVLLDSERGVDLPPERRAIGYVPQDAALFPHLSVRDNIRFGGADGARFESLVAALELGALLDRNPSLLSGGERQRVALARALMTAPRLLLLDEPLAAIDQPLRERILLYLRRVRDLGVPMVYVTHQPFEALALSTWCVVLGEGRVVAEGQSRAVLADPAVAGQVENVFEVYKPEHDPALGITRVTTSDGLALVLPYDQVAEARFPLVVRISADDVVVFGERPSSISSRNVFAGVVTSLRSAEGVVDLTVETPQPLTVRITRAAANDLALQERSQVWLALRSRAFRIVG